MASYKMCENNTATTTTRTRKIIERQNTTNKLRVKIKQQQSQKLIENLHKILRKTTNWKRKGRLKSKIRKQLNLNY